MKVIKVIKINGLYYAIKPVDILCLVSLIITIAAIVIPIAIGYSMNKQTLSSGTIENKWYEPSRTYYYKAGHVYAPVNTKDTWYFTINNGDDTDTFCVDENVYNDYEIGDNYPKEIKQT